MRGTKYSKWLVVIAVAVIGSMAAVAQTPLGTEFTYQGQLKDGGIPANDDYDFLFRLFDSPNAGTQVGGDVLIDDWSVSDGLFTVQLDFGSNVFTGDAIWLEAAVRPGQSGNPYTVLSPRQPLTAAPYALYALSGPGSGGFWAASGDDIYNTNNGDVGIGTTSPIHSLHVESSGAKAVFGENTASGGVGVHGRASDFDGGGFGVHGESYGPTGIGVIGMAAMTTGINYGVYGQSQSQTGRGVYGLGNNAAGVNYGVYGKTNSPDGWAGYFEGRGYFSDKVGIGTTSPISMLELESTADVHGIRSTVPWIPVWAHRDSTTGSWPAIHGECDSEASNGSAIRGIMTSTTPGSFSAAVKGVNNGTGGSGVGVYGLQDGSGCGVYGITPSGRGVWGSSTSGTGVYGSSASGVGVQGDSSTWDGVVGVNTGGDGKSGVYGVCGPNVDNHGVFGRNDRTFHQNYGFLGGPSHGAYGVSDDTLNQEWTLGYLGGQSYSVYGSRWNGNAGTAGYFAGKVHVTGTLSKGGGSFKIDHPLDPENKYLYHSFIESPDMMNIYNGNVTTDENGYAEVTLPEWFDALNRDFRYQLTVIGQFAQAIVGEEIRDNRFVIRTDKPDVKVSWQVTGIRQDPFANEYRIPVEEDKPEDERGMYLHPQAYGQPLDLQIGRIEPLEESQTPSLPLPAPSSNVQ